VIEWEYYDGAAKELITKLNGKQA